MDIQPLDLIIHAANFIIMMLALWLILWKPVSKYIKGRADRVKADREAAENEVKEAIEAAGLTVDTSRADAPRMG